MSQTGAAIPLRARLAERMRKSSPAMLWSGLLMSLTLHAAVIALVIWQLRPLGDGAPPNSGESQLHDVGVILKSPTQKNKTDAESNSEATTLNAKFSPKAANAASQPEVPDAPPIKLEQPNSGNKVIGPGLNVTAAPRRGDPGNVLPNRIGPPPAAAAGSRGNGKASFFDIEIEGGKRIVYVLDRSFSMRGLPLLFAKQKLIASLNGLSVQQRFQVIFFNQVPRAVKIHRDASDPLTPGSRSNVSQAKLRIEGVNDDGSTNHKLALAAAFEKVRSPDVVFFLSDTDSELDTADLREVKKMNKSGARIHCIEFGRGADLARSGNFLKQLAAMNRGKYVYIDVTKLRRR